MKSLYDRLEQSYAAMGAAKCTLSLVEAKTLRMGAPLVLSDNAYMVLGDHVTGFFGVILENNGFTALKGEWVTTHHTLAMLFPKTTYDEACVSLLEQFHIDTAVN
ncbi:hypothetical protein IVB12_15845 [Bradyrhizobium sp. 179]|uniref:hypothetical protein n=1 Tax=Bradyrhizobium sp. 179 TaxID=2782648 RepID=UPI001FF8EAE2|nr:hypothetical protein [Bradyrhizobium sp. 179]MCK1543389.1 hypothetical protein [Bradyrhizobium sp. 179]